MDFDQESFKQRLAATLTGVFADDITLNVTAASVSVTATIALSSDAFANRTMNTLNAHTPETLSSVLGGVRVESIASPTLTRRSQVADGTRVNFSGSSNEPAALASVNAMATAWSTEHVILVVVLATVFALLIVAFVVCWCSCRNLRHPARRHMASAKHMHETFDSMDIPTSDDDVGAARYKGVTSGTSCSALERARMANRTRTQPVGPSSNSPFGTRFRMTEESVADMDVADDPRLRL